MRIAPTNKFKKLWGVINENLKAGVYSVLIYNSINFFIILLDYNITEVGAKKMIVFSTLSALGG
jgi:hypothetical protein